MSLTSELRDKNSWVNRFLREKFSAVNNFVKDEGGSVKSMPTLVPRVCDNPSTLGTAFDYRLRLHFRADFAASEVLDLGIILMAARQSDIPNVDEWTISTMELLQQEPPASEDMQARASVVLAWLDSGYRSGGLWSDGMKEIALAIDRGKVPNWDTYASVVDETMAGELKNLMEIAKPELPSTDAICGPAFVGSRHVGGADADFIIDGCLYDVKTTEKPRDRMPNHVRQLIGYVLLDWNDEYRLGRVGFYFSRQAEWKSWALEEFVYRTTGNATTTLAELRNDFLAEAKKSHTRRG